jgi:hypothetical protein
MRKVVLYFSNVAIAAARVPRSLVGLYKYHADDGYIKNVLVVTDCFLNALAGGDPDETISSRSGKAAEYEQSVKPAVWGAGCRMCAFLAIFQQDHCAKAIERWRGRRAVIPDNQAPEVK